LGRELVFLGRTPPSPSLFSLCDFSIDALSPFVSHPMPSRASCAVVLFLLFLITPFLHPPSLLLGLKIEFPPATIERIGTSLRLFQRSSFLSVLLSPLVHFRSPLDRICRTVFPPGTFYFPPKTLSPRSRRSYTISGRKCNSSNYLFDTPAFSFFLATEFFAWRWCRPPGRYPLILFPSSSSSGPSATPFISSTLRTESSPLFPCYIQTRGSFFPFFSTSRGL